MNEALLKLAEKLGTTVEELGPKVVNFVKMKALCSCLSFAIVTAFLWIATGILWKKSAKAGWFSSGCLKKDGNDELAITFICVALITVIVTFMGFCVVLSTDLPTFLEPTGATVRMLLNK